MRALVAALLIVIGCNKSEDAKPVPKPGSAAPVDPWNTVAKPDPNALPTIGERTKLADAACPAVTGAFFFAVTKNGKTSHILGTRHISVGLAKFPPVVGDTLDHASRAIFEISPDDTGGGEHNPEPLKQELGPKDWAHFEELIGAETAKSFETADPDAAALTMLVLYEDISNTLESQLQERARRHDIPMGGLETSAFQDGVLAKLLDLRMLKATVEQTKNRAEIAKDSHDDLAEYCAGTDDSPGMDAATRGKMLKAGYTAVELDAMDDVLVYKRNADWIPKLEKIFEDDKVFVAVGADHLIGPRGVIELLKKQGFSVTRITK
ncbi:MAG TPA: TraB/GumN family protein [Kofleriaceae bacterium]|nr:TraB/GumN family protein [Kofleriaceae bacterium]